MSEVVTGNVAGLKASQVQALERLYRRRVTPSEIVSAELATTMCEQAFELHRQVGVLIDRRGSVTHVVVGDASKPRLIEKNTMMSRLTGGIGGRGPGETKLEINRRRARDRIHGLEKQLDELAQHRRLRRSRRGQRAVPIVAICGYTNAGKSTLLNALTRGDAIAADKLFATLDPISRRLRFPHEREVVITDTVGFIRDLPKDLTRAFRATLEEMGDADLLLHVVDAADPDRDQHIRAVDAVLTELELADRPRLLVWNKCDRLGPAEVEHLTAHGGGYPVSAMDRATFGPMLLAIERAMWNEGAGPHILARGGASLAGC